MPTSFCRFKPGTEALLYGAMDKVIVDRGLMDLGFIKARCRDYAAFLATIQEYDLLRVAESCGVAPNLIEEAALAYGSAESAMLMFSASMEERSRDSIRAVVNLALLVGQSGQARSRTVRTHRAKQPAGSVRHGHVAGSSARLRTRGR